MSEMNRTIHELLVDYADALRDGSLAAYLKSLSREEGRLISSSREFWDATEAVRAIHGAAFGDKVMMPSVGLFLSRVDAAIGSRMKKAKSPSRARHGSGVPRIEWTKRRP